MFARTDALRTFDDEVWSAIGAENRRQEEHIELIASENYVSRRVLEAQGSVLTNKYAEGYPGRRYYGGCENVDRVERIAVERVKALFGADYANVQPHSGSQANAAVYLALLKPGDCVLGMGMADGGHLTHGAAVNFSGKFYRSVPYGVNPSTGEVDYDAVAKLAEQHRPKVLMAGFSAYSRQMDWRRFREIADAVGAYLVVDMAHVAGLVAAGLYPNPVQIADVTTTTTHKTLAGPRGGVILARANPEIERRLNAALFPGTQGGPLMHVIAAKAVCFKEAATPEFAMYQRRVLANAKTLAAGFMEHGHRVVSNGTDNHLFLLDLVDAGITGKDADAALGRANITVNKNVVPNDPRPPAITSGLRIGSPAGTRRGFGEPEFRTITGWMCDVLADIGNDNMIESVRRKVLELCRAFPVYATC